jgi:hypothetical protein
MHFLLNLFRTLQFLGTVPAIDVFEYLRWVEKKDCPVVCPDSLTAIRAKSES